MKNTLLKKSGIVLLSLGCIIILFPFLWAISLSFKSNPEILTGSTSLFPKTPIVDGYILVFTQTPIFLWFVNSIIVSFSVVVITCFTSALCGYIFAKFKFPFKTPLFLLILSTMMVPFQITMIPVYLICSNIGITDSLLALIIPSMVSGFGVFLCRQFIGNIPNELIEAGRIEGAGEFNIFIKLILPNIKSSLAALAIFTFVSKWNDYVWPLIAINDINKMTVPLALNFFNSSKVANVNAIMSASVITLIPIVIIFLIFQKQFIEGMTISGMK